MRGILTGGPGGPTLPADPGKPVGPWRQRQSFQIETLWGEQKDRTTQNSKIFLRLPNNYLLKRTGAPCVPLPPFSPATPTGPCKQNIVRHGLQCSMLAQSETIKV